MYTCHISEAEPFVCAGIQFGMMLPRDLTDSCEVVMEWLKPEQATPTDRHANFDQIFIILEGAGILTIGDRTTTVTADTVAFIPRNAPHTIRCCSADGLRYLYVNVWGAGVPEPEREWRRAYHLIHERRVAAELVSE